MLAFETSLKTTLVISFKKESGAGCYDVALISIVTRKPEVIMEFTGANNQNQLLQ
jgi:hypothetical protein